MCLAACSDGNGSSIKGSPPFRLMVIDANPASGPDCCTDVCCLGDIDGDGYLDIVLGAENAPEAGLVWYQYPTWRRHPIASGQFTTDGQTADVDADGDVDIVISNLGTGIFWYENPSDPEATFWPGHKMGDGYGHDVEVGDIDGDGDVDVVTSNKKQLTLWEQVAPDEWSARVVCQKPGEGTALADIDGDGDLDIVFYGLWLENPGDADRSPWPVHTVDGSWHNEARVQVADMDGDGRQDVILSVSESEGSVAWFGCPPEPKSQPWPRHDIETDRLTGTHSLQVKDFDLDGDLDVAVAEMHTSSKKRVLVYMNDGEDVWRRRQLSREGSHNFRAGDIDADGDYDIVGKNFSGPGRVIELWENLTAPGKWDYFAADERRPKSELAKMGLVFADVDRDGDTDVIGGSCVYRNPGPAGVIKGPWDRTRLSEGVDVYFEQEIDGDDLCDLVGMSGPKLLWIEASDAEGTSWTSTTVGTVPDFRTQGYTKAQILPGGKPELVFTRGKELFYTVLPPREQAVGQWQIVRISDASEEEGVAAGDIDEDGDVDLAAVAADGHHALWFENPGDGSGDWPVHTIGTSNKWLDRVAMADVDGDDRLDVIMTEESQDHEYNARIYWFRRPPDPKSSGWDRHVVTVLRSVNSMEVADMDGDGDVDIVAAEHTDQRDEKGAPDNLTAVFENVDNGRRWITHRVDIADRSSPTW
jgi:hypothetical protein